MRASRSSSIPNRPAAFLWRYVRARHWGFASLASVIVAAGACAVAVQYGMKMIVDAMSDANRVSANVWGPLAFFLGLIALESILWRTGGWLGCRAIVGACADMRVDLFAYLSNHSMRYFRQHHSGALGNRISATASAAGAIFGALAWSIVPPCVDFLGAVVVLTLVDWRMALALVGFVLVVAVVIIGFGVRGRRLHQAYGEQSARVGGEIVDAISNIWAVQAFSAQQRERVRLEHELGLEARAQRESWMYVEKARVIHDVFLWVMSGSMLGWALWSWQEGAISSGDVVVVSALTFRILHGSRDLALALVATAQQFGVIAEMLGVVAPPHGAPDVPHAKPLVVHGGQIELKQVRYCYPGGHCALDDVTMVVPSGQKVGIVGPSGAGKSTLLSLLQRADIVERGSILIDGQSIREVTHDSLRAAIAVVPQDISLFRRTVLENIRYGRPEATDAEVEMAARQAHCDEFISRLSAGYDTVVGERGAALSGGQRQRIGIARAFLKDAPILLLDEATSALDSHSEQLVKSALAELMRHRTVLAAAHRLSTLSRYDRIVVFSEGRLVEDGTLAELLRSGGLFRRLWDLQAGESMPVTPPLAVLG